MENLTLPLIAPGFALSRGEAAVRLAGSTPPTRSIGPFVARDPGATAGKP